MFLFFLSHTETSHCEDLYVRKHVVFPRSCVRMCFCEIKRAGHATKVLLRRPVRMSLAGRRCIVPRSPSHRLTSLSLLQWSNVFLFFSVSFFLAFSILWCGFYILQHCYCCKKLRHPSASFLNSMWTVLSCLFFFRCYKAGCRNLLP